MFAFVFEHANFKKSGSDSCYFMQGILLTMSL